MRDTRNPADRVWNVLYHPDAEVISPDMFLGMCLVVNANITIEEANALIEEADVDSSDFFDRLRLNWDDDGNRIIPFKTG